MAARKSNRDGRKNRQRAIDGPIVSELALKQQKQKKMVKWQNTEKNAEVKVDIGTSNDCSNILMNISMHTRKQSKRQ